MIMPSPQDGELSVGYPDRFLRGEYLKDEGKFLTKVSRLVDRVSTMLEPTRVQYDMEFLPQPDTVYAYPQALSDRLMTRTLEGVRVSIVKEQDSVATTSIEIHDEDGAIYVSRDSIASDPTIPDAVIDPSGKVTDIPKIPDDELDAFLLSLGGLYSEAESRLLQATSTPVDASLLFSRLMAHSVQTTPIAEHVLPSGRVVRFDSEQSVTDRLMHFSISYETGSEGAVMVARVDRSNGLNISFARREDGHEQPLIPQGGDYVRLIEIIDEELKSLGARQAKRLSKKALARASLDNDIESVLDQNGLDASDSGAA